MRIAFVVLGVIAFVALLFLISSFVIMLVWNALAEYFGFKTINLFIAFLISISLSIVGGAFRSNVKK